MPRKRRCLSATGIYHIVLRSVNQHIIFEENADYQKFLFILSDCKDKYDVDILAYCLMDNHIHLLLRSTSTNLQTFFRSLGASFVHWYNGKYSRNGHLFQDRFYSVVVDTQTQYLSTLCYIHNNPVKANMCRYPSEYKWSSYNAFYGQNNDIVNAEISYELIGSQEKVLDYFGHYVDREIDKSLFSAEHAESRHFKTDEQALQTFYNITNLSTTYSVSNLSKLMRNNYIRLLREEGLTHKQIARLMDVSVKTVQRVCGENVHTPPSRVDKKCPHTPVPGGH